MVPQPAVLQPPAAPVPSPEEVLDLPLSGLTAKGKGGGSVYELLVQEIKTAKLQVGGAGRHQVRGGWELSVC